MFYYVHVLTLGVGEVTQRGRRDQVQILRTLLQYEIALIQVLDQLVMFALRVNG